MFGSYHFIRHNILLYKKNSSPSNTPTNWAFLPIFRANIFLWYHIFRQCAASTGSFRKNEKRTSLFLQNYLTNGKFLSVVQFLLSFPQVRWDCNLTCTMHMTFFVFYWPTSKNVQNKYIFTSSWINQLFPEKWSFSSVRDMTVRSH